MLGDFQQHMRRRNGPIGFTRFADDPRLLLRRFGPVDRPILHDFSVLQFQHVRAVPVYRAHVVADHDDGDAALVEFLDGAEEACCETVVETGRRLVEHEDRRAHCKHG